MVIVMYRMMPHQIDMHNINIIPAKIELRSRYKMRQFLSTSFRLPLQV